MTDEQQINALKAEISGLTGKCEALEQDKENLERTLEENREELERLKDINCSMENELYNKELNMTLLCKEIDRLKAEIETLSRDYVVKAYDKLMAENAKVKKQAKEVRKETAKEILDMLHLLCGEDSDGLNTDDWNDGWCVAMRYAYETISNKIDLEVINDKRGKTTKTKKN